MGHFGEIENKFYLWKIEVENLVTRSSYTVNLHHVQVAASKSKKNHQVKVFLRSLEEESTFRGFMLMAEVRVEFILFFKSTWCKIARNWIIFSPPNIYFSSWCTAYNLKYTRTPLKFKKWNKYFLNTNIFFCSKETVSQDFFHQAFATILHTFSFR